MRTLVGAGLLRECRLPHLEKAVFDNNMAEHFHFVDEQSGKIIDLPMKAANIRLSFRKDVDVSQIDLVIRGRLLKA